MHKTIHNQRIPKGTESTDIYRRRIEILQMHNSIIAVWTFLYLNDGVIYCS